jgi:hypothetical protein
LRNLDLGFGLLADDPFRLARLDMNSVQKMVDLTEHQGTISAKLRAKNSARTFFGTGIRAAKTVCHYRGLLEGLTRHE